jgi:hypothetical protein
MRRGRRMEFLREVVAVKHIFNVAVAGLVCAFLSAGASKSLAAQVTVIDPDQSATVGGWTITAAGDTALVVFTSNTTLYVEKFAAFTGMAPASISFVPGAGADSSIEVTSELITNETGTNWTGFTFSLSGGATFDSLGNSFNPPIGNGSTNSYTSVAFGSTSIAYTGTQNNTLTSSWGNGDGSFLLIDSTGGSFNFIETPQDAPVVVPLPSAAWQTLAGLGGLGLLVVGRNMKRRLFS